MSSYNYLHIHQQEGLVIDVDAMNTALMGVDGCKELYADVVNDPGFKGPFVLVDGQLMIADVDDGHAFTGYGHRALVWDCFYRAEADIMAKYITSGKLVLRMELEGWDDEFFILTKKNVEKKTANDLRF